MKDKKKEYIFVQDNGFHYVDCKDDDDAIECASCIKGTIRIVESDTGKEVWYFINAIGKELPK